MQVLSSSFYLLSCRLGSTISLQQAIYPLGSSLRYYKNRKVELKNGVLKNEDVKVEIRYKVNGREVTETWTESGETADKILERIWKNPRYPENAQIALYF